MAVNSPSTQVHCLKSTALALLAFPSPATPARRRQSIYFFIQRQNLTTPILLSGTWTHQRSRQQRRVSFLKMTKNLNTKCNEYLRNCIHVCGITYQCSTLKNWLIHIHSVAIISMNNLNSNTIFVILRSNHLYIGAMLWQKIHPSYCRAHLTLVRMTITKVHWSAARSHRWLSRWPIGKREVHRP
jgi:hypothetical protein